MKLADVSVRRPVFAVMMSVALIVLGWSSYGGLGLDLMPRTDSPTVNVRAGLQGASAEEIETTITRPIEAAVNTINGIDELRCSSNQGNGNCTITFVLERDIEAATQDVRDKVATVRFPRDTEPPVVSKIDPDAAPVLTLVVFSKRSPKEITQIADTQIKQVLETVQDVGEVAFFGDRRREIRVLLDPNRVNAYGLTVAQIASRGGPPEHRDPRRELHRRSVRVLDAHDGAAARRPGIPEDRARLAGRLGHHARRRRAHHRRERGSPQPDTAGRRERHLDVDPQAVGLQHGHRRRSGHGQARADPDDAAVGHQGPSRPAISRGSSASRSRKSSIT